MAEHARLKLVASGRSVPLPQAPVLRTVAPVEPDVPAPAAAEDKVATIS